MKTIDLSKSPGGSISIAVDGQPARTLYNPCNFLVKPTPGGAVAKLTDETFRQQFTLDDIIKEDGVTQSPFADQAALVTYLTGFFPDATGGGGDIDASQVISGVFEVERLPPFNLMDFFNPDQFSVVGGLINYTGGGNTTPVAPTVSFYTDTRELTASHALGDSEIVMSINGAAFIAYEAIQVDDSAYDANYWRFKIKAATGRNESAIANSPAIEAAGEPSTGIGTGLTSGDVQYKDDNVSVNSSSDIVLATPAGGGFLVPTFNIPVGESGFVATQRKALSVGGERSGIVNLMIGVDPPYGFGDPKCLAAFYWEPDGKVIYRFKDIGGSFTQSAAGVLLLNGYVRSRATASNVYIEVSNNDGDTWTEVASTTRLSSDTIPVDGTLRCKISFNADIAMQNLFNFRIHNGA